MITYTINTNIANLSFITSPSPLSTFSYVNSYDVLSDIVVIHNYLSKDAIPYYTNKQRAVGPHIKVGNGNIITLVSQATVNLSKKLTPTAQH